MSKIIGIDLGTTNSCVSVLEGGVAKIITNAEGGRTTPSVVAFKNGERLVGEAAKRQAVTNPQTVFSIKSKMGYREKVKLDNKLYSPQEVSAMILQTLKARAEEYLGEQVLRAVITVPAYFTDAQRQATKDAGRIAGLKVDRIINEPTAAALAYGLDKAESDETVLVFDLGGGTFDVSILELDHGLYEVKATSGDNKLGGDDFDKAVVDYLVHHFKEETGIDLESDALALGRLREAAEKAKCELSGLKATQINLPFLTTNESGPLHLDYTLTRAKFQELTQHLIDKLRKPTKQALKDAGLITKDLDRVILVGGSTRMPAVVELVKELTGKDPYKGVNPDEVVAMGAAIQGGIINGEVEDLVLIDVTSLSLGIRTSGGIFTPIIPRNTSIPTTESKTFTTAVDNQSIVEIQVLQGERALAADNKVLGNFQLADITPAPAGVPQIEVTFSINRNGIVSVNAKDVLSGKNQTVIMSSDSGLSEEEIASMVKDAEANAEYDEQKRKEAELLNDCEYLVAESNKLLNSDGDFITPEQLELVKSLLEKVDIYIKDNNIAELEKTSSDLKYTINDIMIQKYQSQDNQDQEQS